MTGKAAAIATKRLELRPVRMADAGAFFDHARIPAVAKNAGFLPASLMETKAYLRRSTGEWRRSHPERMTYSIILRQHRQWIGSIELRWLNPGVGEIGFFIHPDQWGNGFATEAATAVVKWAFTKGKAHRLQGSCWTKNAASIRVMKKLGFRKEGILRGYARVGKQLQDDILFGRTIAGR